ncbi:MAG: glycosyltransferase [Clostridia bacterium]|nr:glycosyltransferase [Clostridia bacterium]
MKVLIFSITAGEGHNSTATAIKQYFESRGDTAEVFDAYRYVSKLLYEVVKQGYLLATKDFKTLYSKTYTLVDRHPNNSKNKGVFRIANLQITRKLGKYISEYDPDAIIYTHVFLGVVTDLLHNKGVYRKPVIGVLTDYTLHPLWEEAHSTDRIVIPCDLLRPELYRRGFTDDRIAPIGIPVRKQFETSIPKDEARKKLGLADKFTVLMMGGSMGYGNIAGHVQELDNIDADFQIISVCGNNAEAKKSIDELQTRKRILNYGFTDEIALLMDAADCIITKPGGLTTAEALAKGLPLIVCNPIPGHEERNATFLVNNGVAMKLDAHVHFEDVVYQLMHNPTHLDCMRRAIPVIGKPHSTADLYVLTKELVDKSRS